MSPITIAQDEAHKIINNRVYILLPVHNRKKITKKFIECLVSQTYKNYHLILLDDGSKDGTADMVRSHIQSLTILRGAGDWWWAGALQQGYLWLRSQGIEADDIVLMINDDTQFENFFLDTGVQLINEREGSLLLAQCYSNETNRLIESGVNINWRTLTFRQEIDDVHIHCFSTNGLMMKAHDFLKVKGFRPKLLPHYASDYEYTIRAIRGGLNPIVSPRFRIWLNETTTGFHGIETDDNPDVIFWEYLKKYFSIKSPVNPIYLSSFILLACPWPWKLFNIVRIWKRSSLLLFRKLTR